MIWNGLQQGPYTGISELCITITTSYNENNLRQDYSEAATIHGISYIGQRGQVNEKNRLDKKSESDDNMGEEQKNAEKLSIDLQLFSDRIVTIHGIIN